MKFIKHSLGVAWTVHYCHLDALDRVAYHTRTVY